MKEYYDILELNTGSTEDEIKKSYRRLSKKYHPDLNPNNSEAEEKFKKVAEAYEVLTGKQKPKTTNNFHQHKNVYKARPLKVLVDLDLEDVYYGKEKTVVYQVKDVCDKCSGDGGYDSTTCNQCGGHGRIQQGPFAFVCGNCEGNGKLFKRVCYECNGYGLINKKTEIKLKIPRGANSGSMYTYPNVGDKIKNGIQGDVYFILNIKPHDTYTIDGLNLKMKVTVPILDLILGGEKEFDTLDGVLKIKIPKLTEVNKIFRLKSKGMFDQETNIYGDLYVTINPVLPNNLNENEEMVLNELKSSENFKTI